MLGKRAPVWARGAGVALVVVAAVAAFFHAALLAGIVGLAARGAGYDLRYASLRISRNHLLIDHPDVSSLRGEPVFTAQEIDAGFDLGKLFSPDYIAAITSVAVERPKITLIHRRDGTYNIALPASNPAAPARPFALPTLRLAVRDGSFGLIDDGRLFAHSRRIALQAVRADADLTTHALSRFTFATTLAEEGGAFPIAGRGTLDPARGYELVRVRAKTIGLAPLLDYALDSRSLHIANGVLNDVDARVYGLLDRRGSMERHVALTANLDHFQPYLGALSKPLRDGRGQVRLYDDGLAIPKVDGSIAAVPVRIAGAVYGLAHPTLRLGISGRGDLRRLLTLASGASALPARGPLAFRLFVEGDATKPQILAAFASPRLLIARIPIDAPSGLVALNGEEAALVRSSLRYDGMHLGARGRVLLGKHTGVELAGTVDAPTTRIPYAMNLLGPMLLHGDAVVTGVDRDLATHGVVAGDTGARHLAGVFAFDGRGRGFVGPLVFAEPGDRGLVARVSVDRPGFRGGSGTLWARGLALSTRGPQPRLPGIALPALPDVDGTLDAAVAGVFDGNRSVVAGDAHVGGAHVLGYPIEDLVARARAVDGKRFAVDARYRGPLAVLGAAGGTVALRGRADVPVSIVASGPRDALVTVAGARFTNASIGGAALGGLSAAVRVRGSAFDVYGARLRLAGNDVVAAGSFGNGGTLRVSARDVDLAALRGLGLPLTTGTVTALAEVSGTAAAPELDGGIAASRLALPDRAFAGLPVSASSGLDFDGDTLHLRDAVAQAGPAVASFDGNASGLRGRPAAARYDLAASVRQADIGTLAEVAKTPLSAPAGSLDADVRVRGSGSSPSFAGRIRIPEGSLNGLRFRDATVGFAGTPRDVRVRGGRVTIGSSAVGFDGDVAARRQRVAVHAANVDLSDLNDYFDRGDTLGGRGAIDVALTNAPDALATSGRVRLAHARYRRFDLGATRADWSTRGRTLHADVALGGAAGRASAVGDATLAARRPLRDALHRTRLTVHARASQIDLGTWLPVAGVQTPILGYLNASASARGTYPAIVANAHLDLQRAMVRGVAVRTASLDLRAARARATVSRAVLAIDGLDASASGSAGFAPRDPIDLTLAARSPDAAALAKTLSGKTFDAAGALATTVHVTGTGLAPRIDAAFDADAIRYERLRVPHAHADVEVARSRATLGRGEIDFGQGRLLASGFAPLTRAYALGPANAPIGLSLAADRVDLGQFAALLPRGTVATGTLDGRVALSGTRANPGLAGGLNLSGGTYAGPQERRKITDLVAAVTFARRTATLHDAHFRVGGGEVSADGAVSVADLRDPATTASAKLRLVSAGATVDIPDLIRGRIDGTVTATRPPGGTTTVAGEVGLSSTRVATAALLPKSPAAESSAAPSPVSLDLGVGVGNDVRVQGGPVDIGAKGDLHVGGTLSAPTAAGELTSTGGTLSFYRTFRIQYPSTVTFDPSNGVIPDVDATATTTVDNPQTDVTLHVTGPATALNVGLASQPDYSREQILGLLVGAQALGAVSGVQTTAQNGQQTNPFQAAAQGQLGTLLTQNILEPFSSQLGGAVGLNNLAINYSPGGSVDIGAQKKLFKNVNAVFAQSFNYPPRQSIGLVASPSDATALQLTFFSQPGSNRFDTFEGSRSLQSSNQSVTSVQPAAGTTGFSLSVQRKFP